MEELYTITWGDAAENHVRMEQRGQIVEAGMGFTVAELEAVAARLGDAAELIRLDSLQGQEPAAVLRIRDGINVICGDNGAYDNMLAEQDGVSDKYDKKALMYGKVLNKHARWNIVFDDEDQEADIQNGKGTVVSFEHVPAIDRFRGKMVEVFGEKAKGLKGEGNYYYDVSKCGIGYHGDAERRKVIACRLGADLPIYYQWYKDGKPVGERIEIDLWGGDVYVMSEKAVGTDWKKKKIYTLRHATGAKKYIEVVA